MRHVSHGRLFVTPLLAPWRWFMRRFPQVGNSSRKALSGSFPSEKFVLKMVTKWMRQWYLEDCATSHLENAAEGICETVSPIHVHLPKFMWFYLRHFFSTFKLANVVNGRDCNRDWSGALRIVQLLILKILVPSLRIVQLLILKMQLKEFVRRCRQYTPIFQNSCDFAFVSSFQLSNW